MLFPKHFLIFDNYHLKISRHNTGVNPLYRHVYASYNDTIRLNKGNPSKLAYDLLLRNIGTITLRFKFDELNDADSKRVILYSGDEKSQKFKIYLDSKNNLYLEESNSVPYKIATISPEVWHFLSLRYSGSNVIVNIDKIAYSLSLTNINLNNIYTYIGCSINSSLKPIEHLNGCTEMLAFKDSFATDDEIKNIRDNGESFSVRTYYDEIGRTSIKKIHSKDNTLSKKITYAKKNGLTSTKISSEESYSEEIIRYEYDEVGNIQNIEIEDSKGNIDNRDYIYDGLSRLKTSNINGKINTYEYDSNNNIKKKNSIELLLGYSENKIYNFDFTNYNPYDKANHEKFYRCKFYGDSYYLGNNELYVKMYQKICRKIRKNSTKINGKYYGFYWLYGKLK